MIKEKLNEIIEKYHNETDECYNSFRYDNEKVIDIEMKEEIEEYLQKEKIDFKIETVSGYSNCAYDSDFLAVAWIEGGKLNLQTILLEEY